LTLHQDDAPFRNKSDLLDPLIFSLRMPSGDLDIYCGVNVSIMKSATEKTFPLTDIQRFFAADIPTTRTPLASGFPSENQYKIKSWD
jgi:hypothetical protein